MQRSVTVPPSIVPHISHLLRLRVLQELELLITRLRWQNRWKPIASSDPPRRILRRLTRAEFKHVRETGSIPFEDAVAILVVPPVNRDTKTKERPKPHYSALPESSPPREEATPKRPLPPASILLPTSPPPKPPSENDCNAGLPDVLSTPKVPLYNGVPLFPTKPTRAALHKLLCDLLAVEASGRYRSRSQEGVLEGGSDSKKGTPVKGDQKASHAFLLCSSAETLMRVDVVPLAVALWRLRVWSGEPWTEENGTWMSIF